MCIFLPLDSRDATICCHKLFPPFGVISPPLLHMPHPSSSSQLRKAKTSWLHSGLAWGSPWADEGAWASKPPWESAGAMNRGPKTCCSLCIPVASLRLWWADHGGFRPCLARCYAMGTYMKEDWGLTHHYECVVVRTSNASCSPPSKGAWVSKAKHISNTPRISRQEEFMEYPAIIKGSGDLSWTNTFVSFTLRLN